MRISIMVAVLILLAACAGGERRYPAVTGAYKLGSPYKIRGQWYYPEFDPSYDRTGVASWYGAAFDGEDTANGEIFDRRDLTAAHPTLPLPSIVRVTNVRNGRTLDVRVNDRGPFVDDRLIDLSQAAARRLGFEKDGITPVRVRFLRLADGKGTPPTPTVRTASRPVRLAQANSAPVFTNPPRVVPLAVTRTAVAPATCRGGPQFVQVGAFADASATGRAAAQLGRLGQVVVDPVVAGGQARARLRMGPVATRADALAVLERVHALGYPQATVVPAGGAPSKLVRC